MIKPLLDEALSDEKNSLLRKREIHEAVRVTQEVMHSVEIKNLKL